MSKVKCYKCQCKGEVIESKRKYPRPNGWIAIKESDGNILYECRSCNNTDQYELRYIAQYHPERLEFAINRRV